MFTKLFINLTIAANCFVKDRQGVTAIEYAVIAVAVSAGVFGVFNSGTLTDALNDAFNQVSTNIGSGS